MRERIYIYLAYLLMLSFLLTGISLSRYSKSIPASSQAKVAQAVFEYVPVSATLNGVPVSPIESGINISGAMPGDVLVYIFDIRNFDGENMNQVLLKYDISVIFSPDPGALPLEYEVVPAASYQSAGGTWTLMHFGVEETHSYTLTVTWDEEESAPEYVSQTQTMQIQIDVEQVDTI